MHRRLLRAWQQPGRVAAAVDEIAARRQCSKPGGGVLAAVGVEQVHDTRVDSSCDVKGRSRDGELLDAAAEESADQLPAGLEQGRPLSPNLHPPAGGVLVEVTDRPVEIGSTKRRAAQNRHGRQQSARPPHPRAGRRRSAPPLPPARKPQPAQDHRLVRPATAGRRPGPPDALPDATTPLCPGRAPCQSVRRSSRHLARRQDHR